MTLAFDLPTPADSLLRVYDPRWKMSAVLLGVTALLLPRHLGPLFVGFLGCLLLAWAARLPWHWYRNRILVLVPMLVGLLFFLPLTLHGNGPSWQPFGTLRISLYGFVAAVRLSLKALGILTLILTLLGTTPMPQLLKAAHALYIPGFLIHLVSLTFRYVMLLVEEFGRLRIALRVRGFRNRADLQSYRVVANVTGTLLVRSLERAERVGQAMRCRGFDGRYRTLTEFRSSWLDVLLFVLMVGFAAGVVAWDFFLMQGSFRG